MQYNNIEHVLVDNDGIYHYMYDVNPLHWVIATDGNEYILFEHIEA